MPSKDFIELIGILFLTIILPAILAVSTVNLLARKGKKVGLSILLVAGISASAATSIETFLLTVLGLAAVGALLHLMIELRSKGSLKIHLPQTEFQPNSPIQGDLHLKTKKALEGEKLTIRLVALRVARRPWYLSPWCSSPQGREGRGSPCEEIYRNEILLESEKTYEAGSENTYPFSIPVPNLSNASEPKRPTDWKGETLKKAEIEWLLYAQLEAKGLHITDTKDIAVHP